MRITRRTRAAALAALLTAAVAAPPVLAEGNDYGGIVPRRDGSKAVPFVPVLDPAPQADGFDWGGAGIGAGVAVLLLTGGGAYVVRTR
jgi:hypothetical protein